jgi:hypothetical protein
MKVVTTIKSKVVMVVEEVGDECIIRCIWCGKEE